MRTETMNEDVFDEYADAFGIIYILNTKIIVLKIILKEQKRWHKHHKAGHSCYLKVL